MLGESLTSAFVMFIGIVIVLFRLPMHMSILILKYRAYTDVGCFIGSFILFNLFSNSFIALLTAFTLSLFITGALEINNKYKFIEKILLKNLDNFISSMYRHREQTKNNSKNELKITKKINRLEKTYSRLERWSGLTKKEK